MREEGPKIVKESALAKLRWLNMGAGIMIRIMNRDYILSGRVNF